ncbi:MAG: magnesium chelatase domain-containing protein [Clostridia bacterium]
MYDLAIAASLISSYYNKVIDNKFVFLGEIGLTGEIRSVPNLDNKIKYLLKLRL